MDAQRAIGNFGGTFIYGTGNAITVPVQRYFVDGNLLDVYGPRQWIPDAVLPPGRLRCHPQPRIKPGKKRRGQWVFSVYNLYNRQNPYFIFFDNEGDLAEEHLGHPSLPKVSLFPHSALGDVELQVPNFADMGALAAL